MFKERRYQVVDQILNCSQQCEGDSESMAARDRARVWLPDWLFMTCNSALALFGHQLIISKGPRFLRTCILKADAHMLRNVNGSLCVAVALL